MESRKGYNLEDLIRQIKTGTSDARLAAIRGLGESGDPAAIAHLIKLLDDPEALVRVRAVGALGQFADADANAIEPLRRVLIEDKEPEVRGRAARVLGQFHSPSVIEALGRALKDESADVRRRVVQALNQISDVVAAFEPLLNALSDPDRDVRRWAARKLGQTGDPAAIEPLKKLLADPYPLVREEAAQAIRAIHDQQSLLAQRKKVEELRQQLRQTQPTDTLTQVRLDGQIDLEQLAIYRLEASLAAQEVPSPSLDDVVEQERERQSVIYELQRHIRELERLSTSFREPHMRQTWEIRLKEANEILTSWKDQGNKPSIKDMQAELQRIRQEKDKLFKDQSNVVVMLIQYIQEGYRRKLQIEQAHHTLSDPGNREKVAEWQHKAEAEYNLLKIAREQGDHDIAKEHHSILLEIQGRADGLKDEEKRAKKRTGRAVILFIILATFSLGGVLYYLNCKGLANTKVPALNVPYAVIVWSAIGSIAAMLYQFLNRPVSQLETFKWLVARPMQGIIMGSFLYLIIAAGLLVSGNQTSNDTGNAVRPELAAVIAFLGGFSDRFVDEMVKRATSILTQQSSEQPQTSAATNSSSNQTGTLSSQSQTAGTPQ